MSSFVPDPTIPAPGLAASSSEIPASTPDPAEPQKAEADQGDGSVELFLQLLVVGLGIFLGLIAGIIIAAEAGWLGFVC